MAKPIRGRVARILNAREVVINRGFLDGVTQGMRFGILDPLAEDILDPETKQPLGSVSRTKVNVKVTSLSDHLAVARTDDYYEVNTGGSGAGLGIFASMLEPRRVVRQYKTLKTSEATWEPLDESESYVKTGDPVVQVTEDVEGVAGRGLSEDAGAGEKA